LVCKLVNGLIWVTDNLRRMYPDAVFLGVVRDGMAVCEGNMRRGADARAMARLYRDGCTRMLAAADSDPRYHIIRFEDVLADPRGMLERIYGYCGLDVGDVDHVRFVAAPTIGRDGSHAVAAGLERDALVWRRLDELPRFIQADVNRNQLRRLPEAARALIIETAGDVLRRFGYLA
ncbi:MAG: sulfotransferase, partial [Lentisphaerae bacterium]|nr:sulfotransferase [Lentisphaerota bacterium]